jgi:hypothetical protein
MDGPVASAAQGRAQTQRARAILDRAGKSAPAVAAARRANQVLDVLIDRTRPDDREIAEKVLAALFRLQLAGRIVELPAAEFAARVRSGACDLYIGQLTPPSTRPDLVLASAFFAGGDAWPRSRLARGNLDRAAADRAFDSRLPIVPLFHRAIHVHHRANLRGVRFDEALTLAFWDLFFHGRARRAR